MMAGNKIMGEGDILGDGQDPRLTSSFNNFEVSYLSLERKLPPKTMLTSCPPGAGI
jgi:hypothetical protein